MADDEPAALDAYVRALVRLLHARAEPLASVVEREGLTVEAFRKAEASFCEALADAHVRRKGALSMRFAEAFSAAQRALGFASDDATAPVPNDAAGANVAAVQVPSFLQHATPATPATPQDGLAETIARMVRSHGGSAKGATVGLANNGPVAAAPGAQAPASLPFVASQDIGTKPAVGRPAAPVVPDLDKGFTAAPGAIDLNALPFGSSNAAPPRGSQHASPMKVDLGLMPLERYAEVSLAFASGEPRETVLRRFLLTEDIWLALARAWGERIATSADLRAQYDQVVRRLRGR